MRDAVDGCEAVVHLAAVPSVAQSVEDPVGCDSVNHGGTVNAVRQAVEAGAERFVLASSCAVYGDAAQLPIAETAPPHPLSPYAVAKLASEGVCADAADAGQLAAVCLRFFNVYGPRQDPGSAYSGVIAASSRPRPPASLSPSTATAARHATSSTSATWSRPCWRALRRPLTGASVVNVGTGGRPTCCRSCGVVEEQAGERARATDRAARDGDIRRSRADAGRARGCSAGRPGPRWPPASRRRGRGSPARRGTGRRRAR